jgi:hypothetical protein
MLATQDVCETEVPVELTLRDRLIFRAKAISMDQLMFARDAAEFAATNDYELEGSVSPIDWKSGNGWSHHDALLKVRVSAIYRHSRGCWLVCPDVDDEARWVGEGHGLVASAR